MELPLLDSVPAAPPSAEDEPGVVTLGLHQRLRSVTQLMGICAFLAPADIPRSLFLEGWKSLLDPLRSVAADRAAFDKLVAWLAEISQLAVDRAQDSLSMPLDLKTEVRDRQDEDTMLQCVVTAAQLLLSGFPDDPEDRATWPQCERLLPHVDALLTHVDTRGIAAEVLVSLSNHVGNYLVARSRQAGARRYFERFLARCDKTLGPEHPDRVAVLNNLTSTLLDPGEVPGAQELFERALAIQETTNGRDHPAAVALLSNLGQLRWRQGDLAGARALFERCLAIMEKSQELDDPDVAVLLTNLGSIRHEQGDLAGARGLLERAVALGDQTQYSLHPGQASRLASLCRVLVDQDDRLIREGYLDD
jgi:tetratricopeptide (TPR) repeat protein